MQKDSDMQKDQKLDTSVTPEDSLDDSSRRELLGRIARAGAAAVPVSLILMDKAKANTQDGSNGGISF